MTATINPNGTLKGKTALVTGASRGIGEAIAARLAMEGAKVVVSARTAQEGESRLPGTLAHTVERLKAAGAEAVLVKADLAQASERERLVEEAEAAFGSIAILINNAAIRPLGAFLEMPEDKWDRVLAVDLHAAIHLSRAFLPGMVDRGWGRIVNLTGMNAMHGYNGRAAVSVSKHGLWGLTKALGTEFGGKGGTVNAISPGPIGGDYGSEELGQHIQSQEKLIPVGRLGEPRHIASLASHLVSDDGGFINCQMIACNGGTQT